MPRLKKDNRQKAEKIGRPTQAIGIGQSPDQKSIIKNETSYDKFNRPIGSLLPVAAGSTVYSPITNAKSLAQSFYADGTPTDSTIGNVTNMWMNFQVVRYQ